MDWPLVHPVSDILDIDVVLLGFSNRQLDRKYFTGLYVHHDAVTISML